MTKHRFEVIFKRGPKEVARVVGVRDVPSDDITVADVGDRLIAAEQLLERLTGFRVHIQEVI